MCAQVRVLQHEKERLERVQQEKQDLENKFYDEMKRYAINLQFLFRERMDRVYTYILISALIWTLTKGYVTLSGV